MTLFLETCERSTETKLEVLMYAVQRALPVGFVVDGGLESGGGWIVKTKQRRGRQWFLIKGENKGQRRMGRLSGGSGRSDSVTGSEIWLDHKGESHTYTRPHSSSIRFSFPRPLRHVHSLRRHCHHFFLSPLILIVPLFLPCHTPLGNLFLNRQPHHATQ